MGILLTDKEELWFRQKIGAGATKAEINQLIEDVKQAQLKKVVGWLEKATQPVHGGIDLTEEDWQALKKEAGID